MGQARVIGQAGAAVWRVMRRKRGTADRLRIRSRGTNCFPSGQHGTFQIPRRPWPLRCGRTIADRGFPRANVSK